MLGSHNSKPTSPVYKLDYKNQNQECQISGSECL